MCFIRYLGETFKVNGRYGEFGDRSMEEEEEEKKSERNE